MGICLRRLPKNLQESTVTPKLRIIMVHGTWGRGFFPDSKIFTSKKLRWFEPGSPFHTALLAHPRAKGIETETRPLKWSGANSFRQRDEAGKRLAEMIDAEATAHFQWPVLIIGHSHGGNVIGRAMTHTRSALDRTYAATLATPFLEVFKTATPRFQVISLHMLGYLIIISLFFTLLFLALSSSSPGEPVPGPTAVVVAGILFFMALTLFVLPDLVYMYVNKQNDLLERISSQSALADIVNRTLVVRGIDDEAALVIAGGAIAARMISLTLSIVGVLGPSLLFIVMPVISVLFMAWVFLIRFLPAEFRSHAVNIFKGWPDAPVSILLIFLIVVLLSACVFVLVLLSAMFRATYGREMMLAGLNCEVSVHSAPDGTAASVVTLRQCEPARRLRHYIYDHPHCATTVAHWIASGLQAE
jgi:hypothetical protein